MDSKRRLPRALGTCLLLLNLFTIGSIIACVPPVLLALVQLGPTSPAGSSRIFRDKYDNRQCPGTSLHGSGAWTVRARSLLVVDFLGLVARACRNVAFSTSYYKRENCAGG